MVSVILTTHRAQPYLAAALESVRVQSFAEWELVVVDDGWDDKAALRQALDGISTTRVLATPTPNSGVATARNVGLASAQGELVVFLDHDDIWKPTFLSTLVSALDEDPDAVGSFCDVDVIDSDGRFIRNGVAAGPYDYDEMLRGGRRPSIQTIMARRKAVESIGGFRPGYEPSEDVDYIYRLGGVGPLRYVPTIAASYRRHDGGVSNDVVACGTTATNVVRDLAAQLLESGDEKAYALLAENRQNLERYWVLEANREAWALFRRGSRREALSLLAWTWRYSPRAAAYRIARLARPRRHHRTDHF